MKTHKLRLYPTKRQQETLENHLEICRRLYIRLLCEIKKSGNNRYSYNRLFDTQALISKQLKTEQSELNNVYSKVLQMVNHNLWSSIKSKCKQTNGVNTKITLRYKGEGWYKTLNYNQSGFKIIEKTNRIYFSKIGLIKTKIHTKFDLKRVKGIIVKKYKTGKWFALI